MVTITLDQLTEEQKNALRAQVLEEERAKASQAQNERQAYKELVEENIPQLIRKIKKVHHYLRVVKTQIVKDLEYLVNQKKEVYNVENNQKSHTFTTKDGKLRIVYGYKMVRGWDGTEAAGVGLIKDYVAKHSKTAEGLELSKVILNLLKEDKDGNLKPNRAMELYQLKNKIHDEDFVKGVEIIMEAYREYDSALFIEAYEKDETLNKYKPIQLSLPSVPLNDETNDRRATEEPSPKQAGATA